MESASHGYIGRCTYEQCTHRTKSIYKSCHNYTHFNNQLVHDNCYRQLHRQIVSAQELQHIQQLQQQVNDYQSLHPPLVISPPPKATCIPAIVIAMEQPTILPPSPHIPLQSPSTVTHQQNKLLEVLHSFIQHHTYTQYRKDDIHVHPLGKETYYIYITKTCIPIVQLYEEMIHNNEQHMQKHTNSNSKYKVAVDFSWTHKNSRATGGWMPLIDIQSNIVLETVFEYKSREIKTKTGEKKTIAQGNYPNNKSAHAMELTAFLQLIDTLLHNNLLDSIDTIVTDEHTGIERELKSKAGTQHIKHLHDPFHIGKNIRKNAKKKLETTARSTAKQLGNYRRGLPGRYKDKCESVARYTAYFYLHQLKIAKSLYGMNENDVTQEYMQRITCLPSHITSLYCPPICPCKQHNDIRKYKELAQTLNYYAEEGQNLYLDMIKVQYNNYIPPTDSREWKQEKEKAWLNIIDPIEAKCIIIWSEQVMNTLNDRCDIHPYTSSPCESLNSEIKSFISTRIEYWKHGVDRMKYSILRHNYAIKNQLHDLYTKLLTKLELPLDAPIVQEYIHRWIDGQHKTEDKVTSKKRKHEYIDEGEVKHTQYHPHYNKHIKIE